MVGDVYIYIVDCKKGTSDLGYCVGGGVEDFAKGILQKVEFVL